MALGATLLGREPAATGLSLEIYRLTSPRRSTRPAPSARWTPTSCRPTCWRVIPIPRLARSGTLQKVYTGAALDTIAIPAADAGVLALGYRIVAPGATGVRIGSTAAGSAGPTFLTYLQPLTSDTSLLHQPPLPRIVAYNGFVSSVTPVADPATITVAASRRRGRWSASTFRPGSATRPPSSGRRSS